MKLLSLKIIKADTCGGLLDGLSIPFRNPHADTSVFDPLCLVGPNGTGKSQLLQVIAEIFQTIFQEYLPEEERGAPNADLLFELEYLIRASKSDSATHVRIRRNRAGKK